MESSPEQFETLQKLLKLKRYEHPHPRYFNTFSSQVISRIEAGGALAALPWWQKFGIDLRALMTVGAGAAACVALFFGMAGAPEGANANTLAVGAPSLAGGNVSAGDAFTQADSQNVAVNSTNPVYNAAGIMRPNPFGERAMPVSFQMQ